LSALSQSMIFDEHPSLKLATYGENKPLVSLWPEAGPTPIHRI
jgi:hypothetical protein